MLGIRARAMWCVLLVLGGATVARPRDTGAQSVSGSIAGTVTDEQGASVPGATVTVTDEATGAARTTIRRRSCWPSRWSAASTSASSSRCRWTATTAGRGRAW